MCAGVQFQLMSCSEWIYTCRDASCYGTHLAIATSCVPSHGLFEQTLAMSNIARMLKPGGVLCNNSLPQGEAARLRLAGSASWPLLIPA